jgi:hypothetical protein
MQEFQHHHFSVEAIEDKHGPAILLEQQEGIDDPMAIVVHPWQLRAACEHLGIIASNPLAERTIATLSRRIKSLASRVEYLAEYLETNSDSRHADLSYEQTYARATADLAAEFIAEIDDSQADGTKPTQDRTSKGTPATSAPLQNLHGSGDVQLSIDA